MIALAVLMLGSGFIRPKWEEIAAARKHFNGFDASARRKRFPRLPWGGVEIDYAKDMANFHPTREVLRLKQIKNEGVEVWGFEPQASSLRTTRSTN